MYGPHKYVIKCVALVEIVTWFLAQSAIWVGHSWSCQSIYFTCWVGFVSFYSNRISSKKVASSSRSRWFVSITFLKIILLNHRGGYLINLPCFADEKGWFCRVFPFTDTVEKLIYVGSEAVAATADGETVHAILFRGVSVNKLIFKADCRTNTIFRSVTGKYLWSYNTKTGDYKNHRLEDELQRCTCISGVVL